MSRIEKLQIQGFRSFSGAMSIRERVVSSTHNFNILFDQPS